MVLQNEVVGVLSMWRTNALPFTARECELLEEFAGIDGEAVNHPLSKGFVDKLKEMFG